MVTNESFRRAWKEASTAWCQNYKKTLFFSSSLTIRTSKPKHLQWVENNPTNICIFITYIRTTCHASWYFAGAGCWCRCCRMLDRLVSTHLIICLRLGFYSLVYYRSVRSQLNYATWCDMKWCDMKWCDVMWHDVTWRDVTWRDVTWHDVTWRDLTWSDVTWREVTWSDVTWRVVTFSLTKDSDIRGIIHTNGPIKLERYITLG